MSEITNSEQKRLFVGIALPERLKLELHEVMQPYAEQLKVVKKENFHITLVFIGRLDEKYIPELSERIQRIAGITHPFLLKGEKIRAMPSKRPRMFWLQWRETKEFIQLVAGLQSALASVIPAKDPQYKDAIPHTTLARGKDFRSVRVLAEEPLMAYELSVRSIFLYESVFSKTGSSYTVLREFSLKKQ